MESNLSEADLRKVKELGYKGIDLWSEFSWFDDEGMIKLILS